LANLGGLALAGQIWRWGTGGIVPVLAGGLIFVAGLFFSETAAFPAGLLLWVSHVAGFGLLMVILLGLGSRPGQVRPAVDIRRLAIGNGIGQILLVAFSFAYYVAYDLAIGFRPAAVLPMAGVLVLLCAAGLARNMQPVKGTEWGYESLVVGAVLLVLPLSGWLNRASPQPAVHGERIRVMNYNLHNGFNTDGRLDLEAIAKVIESSQVDVVGLQEVSRGWVINGSVDMVQWLSQRLDMAYVFGPTEGALWGNAILSRYPIVQAGHFPLPPESLLLRRGYLTADIDAGSRVLQVTVTHLHHRADDSDIRQEQVTALLAGHSDVAGLLMGDLNAIPDSPEMSLLARAGWVDVLAGTVSPASVYTYPADGPARQIDYIWLSPNLPFSGAAVMQTTASDHLPVIVTIGPFD
jgi:endonuclease/exonuclease/phosphatase family metal-dependent hydrolase